MTPPDDLVRAVEAVLFAATGPFSVPSRPERVPFGAGRAAAAGSAASAAIAGSNPGPPRSSCTKVDPAFTVSMALPAPAPIVRLI